MNIFALLSWYDEEPDHLRRVVRSLDGFADVLVAVDGAYSTFPDATAESPHEQSLALFEAAHESNMRAHLCTVELPWNSEVQKRAAMFECGRRAGATPNDWFLIIDADMELAEFAFMARDLLEETDCDVAELNWHDIQINDVRHTTFKFRSMFRALPGLTVERAHYLYTTPEPDHPFARVGRRFLWLMPNGHPSPEPVLDLSNVATLHHYNSGRDMDRRRRAIDYYTDRDANLLEAVGDWR